MADLVVSAVVDPIIRQLGSLALQSIGRAWGLEAELEKLKRTLSTVNAVLLDAEQQQTHNHEVKDWLAKLKYVVSDAENLLDEFTYEDLRKQVVIHGSKRNKVRNFLSSSNPIAFRFEMGQKLKDIRDALDEISEDRRKFHFTELALASGSSQGHSRVREQTHSFVSTSDVLGRNREKMKIINVLVQESDDEQEPISVIPIVGFGGLGKTTLAQLVYNDERVVGHFDSRLWVCVSDNKISLKKLMEKVVKSLTGNDFDNLEMDQLQILIRNGLDKRKFFLVLDDVWDDDGLISKWEKLKSILVCGAVGSRILVTTRSQKVAKVLGTVDAHNLKFLRGDDCWSLFKTSAFRKGEENKFPNLVKIGKRIVEKCNGVPLAAKSLGGMLFANTNERDWLDLQDNEIWRLPQNEDSILNILRLSYDMMSPPLKQCFAYCSTFPKDHEIDFGYLISLWTSEGYIQSFDDNQKLENIGLQYFNELLSRCFFQDVHKSLDGTITKCKMHDIVHDLALSVGSSEWSIIGSHNPNIHISEPEGVRHLLFKKSDSGLKNVPTSLLNAKKAVRSVCFSFEIQTLGKSLIEDIIKNFKCLRVMELSGSQFDELPSSVGSLKHLRYISLRENRCIKRLPNSICMLLNLQSLDVANCSQLVELPKDIGMLVNLRRLRITSQQLCLPPEAKFQSWVLLQHLLIYKCNQLTSLSHGMQHLTALRDLRISTCSMLRSFPYSIIKYLRCLERLLIIDCPELDFLNENEAEGEECMAMTSHCQWRLQFLVLVQLPKLVTLSQAFHKFSSTIEYLSISKCDNFSTLPQWLSDLTSLKKLSIRNCHNVLSLPKGMDSLTALRQLDVTGSSHLIERCQRETGEDWPLISHVPKIVY